MPEKVALKKYMFFTVHMHPVRMISIKSFGIHGKNNFLSQTLYLYYSLVCWFEVGRGTQSFEHMTPTSAKHFQRVWKSKYSTIVRDLLQEPIDADETVAQVPLFASRAVFPPLWQTTDASFAHRLHQFTLCFQPLKSSMEHLIDLNCTTCVAMTSGYLQAPAWRRR